MGKWAGAHTSVDNLPKGFPKHLRGDVKDVAQHLIKKHFLPAKPTPYGLEVSLNPEMKKEIEEMTRVRA
ncbi:hypothetical protein HYX14_04130 [Candidatus Woesearchaeota archaeon]|nr:hypothetical protein [Candidatus Woesearchaeota archaeon]